MREIRNSLRAEARVLAPGPSRPAGTKASLVEQIGDLGVDVVIEEPVDELHDLRRRFHFLRGGLRIPCRERLDLPAFEADVDLGDPFFLELDERRVLDDVGEEPFALAVGRFRGIASDFS